MRSAESSRRPWLSRLAWALALLALPLAPVRAHDVQPSVSSAPEIPVAPPSEPSDQEDEPAAQAEWNPVPPTEEVWDWIQLNTDEWLKGQILRLRDEKFEFDSDKMKERTFKWRDIKQIYSARPRTWRFRGGVVLTGPAVMRGDSIVVSVDGNRREKPRRDLIAIIPGVDKEQDLWRAKLNLGMAVRAGNTNQFDLNVDAFARRETAKTRLRFDYDSAIGTLNDEDTKNLHRGTVRLDYYQTYHLFYIPAYLELFHDRISNIDLRSIASAGLGYHLSRGIFDWVVYSTAGYQYQRFASTQPGEDRDDHNGALMLGTTFKWEITGDLTWENLYQFQLAFPQFAGTSQRATTSLKYDLTRILLLETALNWDRVEQPRQEADGTFPKSDDVRLTVGFGVQY